MLLALVGLRPAPAVAQEPGGLDVDTTAAYSAYPSEGRVEVQFGYVFANTADGVSIPGFFESLPESALEVTATSNGAEIAVLSFEESEDFTVWFVAFETALDPGDEVTVILHWVIADVPGSAWPIVEPGAAAFEVFAPGPDGANWHPATVEIPDDFTPLDPAAPQRDGGEDGRVRFEIATDAPYQLAPFSSLGRDRFMERTIDLPPVLTIADWSLGDGWRAAIEDRSASIVTTLDTWFGPRDDPFEVRRGLPAAEHPAVALDSADPFVTVAGDAASVIDHQLAHAWLADVPVVEDWFVEGLAAAFAGGQPSPADAADIVPALANEIGPSGVRSVVDALRTATITYPGVEFETQPLPPDWRTLLDLLEGVGGSSNATSLFLAGVVDAEGAAAIDRRAAARIDYGALEDRAGVWVLPPLLRLPMAGWDFDTFLERQGEVSETILQRDSLHEWAEELELDRRDDTQELFESATADMAGVDALMAEQLEALEAFAEAEELVTADSGLLARVGLWGSDPDADLVELRAQWAEGSYGEVAHGGHELAERVEGAVGRGTIRILVPATVVIALWQLVRWLLHRRRRTPSDQLVEA